MRIPHLIFLLTSVTIASVSSTEPDAQMIFQRANNLYRAGKYADALQQYEQVSPKGTVTWQNMSTCHHALGNIPETIACLTRAQYGASYHELYHIDKKIAQLRASDGTPPEESWLAQFYNAMLHAVYAAPPMALQLIFLLLWYMTLIPWIRRRRRPHFAQLALMALLAPAILATYTRQHTPLGIIATGGGSLYAGPDSCFRKLSTLTQGDSVVVRDKQKEWYKVCHANHTGWVPAQELLIITPEQT